MKKVLGLDISSSTIGWSLLSFNDEEVNLVSYGHLKPPPKKKGSLSFRLDTALSELNAIIKKYNPDYIAVEDYAKRFKKGSSSANTIIMLSVFNEACCLLSYQEVGEPFRYPVVTIRATLKKFFKKSIVSKDDVFPVIVDYAKNYKTQLNRVGNLKKECFDEVDAIAVAMTFVLKEFENGQRYKI